jgi:hypothetical protein
MVGLALMAVAMAVSAVAVWTSIALVAFGLAGLGFVTAVTSASTLIQLRVPPQLRGRVMALWLMGLLGTRPIAALFVGLVSDHLDVRAALLLVAVSLAGMSITCRPSRVS